MDKTSKYVIALAQLHGEVNSIEINFQKAERAVRNAVSRKAKLICFPEAFLTGYGFMQTQKTELMAVCADSPQFCALQDLAKEFGIYVLLPMLEKTPEGIRNSAFLIDDHGSVAGRYSKTHLLASEKGTLSPGDAIPVWDTPLGKIGCLICYDVCFPETARLLAMSGAELILVPSAWRASRYYVQWWDLNIACRALDNLVYVAAVNQVGECGRDVFAGRSKVCDPVGSVIAQASDDGEEILYCDIELGRIAQERADNTVLTDLRPELYGFDRVK